MQSIKRPLPEYLLSRRAIAYDQLQPMVVASHNLSAGRPCERRDPSPLAPKVKKRPLLQCRNESPRRMGPCVRRDDSLKIPYVIALPIQGAGPAQSPTLPGEAARKRAPMACLIV
jgi:hypothetical protein